MIDSAIVPKELADIVFEAQINLDLQTHTQDEALRELVGLLAGNKNVINAEKLCGEVVAREALSPTVMHNGSALPHARTDTVLDIVLAVGRSASGVLFANQTPVHLIFVIGTPKNAVADYLVCVGTLARLLRNTESMEHLMKAGTAPGFAQILRTAMKQHV
jgi:mannitol/fructose-specific phosphotransferase system IIA component (Ntr-type)